MIFLEIKLKEKEPKRVQIELIEDKVEKTCEIFRCLYIGEKGEKLIYKGSKFHTIVKTFMIQGGI